MSNLKIGALARQTGTNAPTIRYYEEIGLLRSAGRQAGNQRVYSDADVKSLTFIRRCRELGSPSIRCVLLRHWCKTLRAPAGMRVTLHRSTWSLCARSSRN